MKRRMIFGAMVALFGIGGLVSCHSGNGKEGKTAAEDSFEDFECPCCVVLESTVVVDEPETVVVDEPMEKKRGER